MKVSKTNFTLMSGLVLTLVLLMGNIGRSANAEPNLNVRVVDVTVLQQQFVNEINDKLKGEFKDRQADLQKQLDKFKTDQEKFQKNVATMSKDQATSQAENLTKTQMELQQRVAKFDQQVADRRQDEMQQKLNKLLKVVQNISSKEKYDMVLAKTAALYVDDKYDITKSVTASYNQK